MKDIKSPLLWCEKHHFRFPIVKLLARQILGIVGSQIKMEHIFSLDENLTNLRSMSFATRKPRKTLIFLLANTD